MHVFLCFTFLPIIFWSRLLLQFVIRFRLIGIRGNKNGRFLKLNPRGVGSRSLKIELDDFRRRADLDALLREERERIKSKDPSAISFLNSWVKERIDYLVCGTEKLRELYLHEPIYAMVFLAEKSYLLNQLQGISNYRNSLGCSCTQKSYINHVFQR